MALSEKAYNDCNKIFRNYTNQQAIMVDEVSRLLNSSKNKLKKITSYGCGFGMFELQLIDSLNYQIKVFQGIDSNKTAISKLAKNLKNNNKIDEVKLFAKDMTTTDPNLIEHSDLGLFIHSIYYLKNYQELAKTLRSALKVCDKLIFAVTPLNELNIGFATSLRASGTSNGVFSDDVEHQLTDMGISYNKIETRGIIRIPSDINEHDIRHLAAFIYHDETYLSLNRETVLKKISELSRIKNDIEIDHPVILLMIN